ncbi:glycosyltransferase family 2 protein [Candidatus Falkowbacteria bacterium]|nr:glycosyltransferase family 2 protein [Candidatus Falkowbacteria bacterium]
MDLSIITVSWNVKKFVADNIKSIFADTRNIEFEILVVDNDSKDGTAEMIKKDFPRVRLIANNYNAGFAKANNQAIKEAKGRYLLLLNPDMRVLPGTLEKMVRWMDEHNDVGVAGCRLIKENGETVPHVRRYPRLFDQLAIVFKLPHLFPGLLNDYLKKDFDYLKEAEVDSIRGSFFMIRREVAEKIGGLDERYFVWFEEVDYCRQVKNAGWKVMYTPAADCVDYVGQSFSLMKRGQSQKYFSDSMLKYFKKWQPAWQYWILKIAWPIGRFIAVIGEKLNYKNKART